MFINKSIFGAELEMIGTITVATAFGEYCASYSLPSHTFNRILRQKYSFYQLNINHYTGFQAIVNHFKRKKRPLWGLCAEVS
jgi:hypothetical protein